MNTRFIFVRHGELEGENSSILHGANDPVRLSDKGKETMQNLASRLEDFHIEVIVSSSEIRTTESAEILSQLLHKPVEFVDELQGRKWGEFAGRSWDEVGKILSRKTLEERYEFVPPGGESWRQFEERLLGALHTLIKKYLDKNICVVSHGSSVRVLLPKVFGIPVEESLKLYPDYGSISTVEFGGINFDQPVFNLL